MHFFAKSAWWLWGREQSNILKMIYAVPMSQYPAFLWTSHSWEFFFKDWQYRHFPHKQTNKQTNIFFTHFATHQTACGLIWGPEQEKAFADIKERVITQQKLWFLDYSKPIYLRCDTSKVGCGTQLFQLMDGQERRSICLQVFQYSREKLASVGAKTICSCWECPAVANFAGWIGFYHYQ